MATIEDKKQPTYLVRFTSEGKKHFRKLKTNINAEILEELHRQGFIEVIIVEVTKI